MTVKLSHERKVRSLAKKTLGSTRVGRAMRLPVGEGISEGWVWEDGECLVGRLPSASYPGQSGGEAG
jgi:hypothetical protein